eukprot:TRINITY_DN2893_c0_g1_i1.p1 TRINITY_DN2893_c0_g1~~TRINITY_DN2893_c0_g1_i1.p1  ORF type:complete len:403 (+),score=13.57 TRINITY_DN2893_c0_g1_i1:405-1613(+)
MLRHWDDPNEADLHTWLRKASQVAELLILPFGFYEDGLGLPEFSLPSTFNVSIGCPTVTISVASRDMILSRLANSTGRNLTATLVSDDGFTPLRSWFHSGWFWALSVACAAFSCAVSVIGLVKLVEYLVYSNSTKISVVSLCILLETAGSVNRFLMWTVDVMGARQLTTQAVSGAWRTSSLPFTISATLLLTFFWHETLSRTSLKISMNVSRLKIPCYLAILFVFVVEIVIDALRFTVPDNGSTIRRSFNAIVYIIFAFLISVFYIVTAIRIFVAIRGKNRRQLSSNGTATAPEDQRRTDELLRTTIKLFTSALFMILMVFVAVTSLLPYYSRSPMNHLGYIFFWLAVHTLLNAKAIATLLSFTTRGSPSRNTTATKSGTGGATASVEMKSQIKSVDSGSQH